MTSVRYFAPEFRVEINGAGLAADVSKNITDLSVSTEPYTLDSFDLTLANPYPELPWTHTGKAELFREGNSLKVWMGYVDDQHLMFDGEITGMTLSFPESGTPTVGISGHSRLHRLNVTPRRRTFREMTDREIVEQIAAEAGLTARADDTGTTHPYVLQNNQTDYRFLAERARAIRFELYMEGTTLYFTRPRDAQPKEYTLVWGRTQSSFNPSLEVFPLQSFTPQLNAQNQVGKVVVRGQDPVTREPIRGEAGSGSEDSRMGGSETGPEVAQRAFGAPGELVVTDEPVASQAEAEQRARAIYNRRAMDFIRGSGTTLGLPALRAGTVVRLDGLGPRFNGEYYVSRSTHSIGSGGYRTNFEVQKNSVG